MATTITRFHVTDDSGTLAAPVLDGTPWGDAQLQQVFDAIDDLLAGNVTVGGVLRSEGFGIHQISASGSGFQEFRVANMLAGTGNGVQLGVIADTSVVAVRAHSASFTPSGHYRAAGGGIYSNGAGGLVLSSVADIKAYAGGVADANERIRVLSTGETQIRHENVTFDTSDYAPLGVTRLSTAGDQAYFSMTKAGTSAVSIGIDSAARMWFGGAASGKIASTVYMRLAGSEAVPGSDNVSSLGTASLRWAHIWGTVIHPGDIEMENGFVFTEHDKLKLKTPGVALKNPKGDLVAFFAHDGGFYCGEARPLQELR